jgi:hypothetical protein
MEESFEEVESHQDQCCVIIWILKVLLIQIISKAKRTYDFHERTSVGWVSKISLGYHLGILMWTHHGITLNDTLTKNLIIDFDLCETNSRGKFFWNPSEVKPPYPSQVLKVLCILGSKLFWKKCL